MKAGNSGQLKSEPPNGQCRNCGGETELKPTPDNMPPGQPPDLPLSRHLDDGTDSEFRSPAYGRMQRCKRPKRTVSTSAGRVREFSKSER